MDNRISGLTALDPRVAATERFIQQKKIPPNQVADFLLSMGADPRLAGLVMKYQRLKAESATQPKGPAPATTVAQDIDAQIGLPAAAEAARQPVPTSRGVASIPAPVMERAQFAGGGIVAFAGEEQSVVGDPAELDIIRQFVPNFDNMSPEQQAVVRDQLSTQIARRRAEGPKAAQAPVKPPSLSDQYIAAQGRAARPIEGYRAELVAEARARGEGAAAEAMRKKIEERMAGLQPESKRAQGLALAQIGAQIMEAASRPGATALGSIGSGAARGIPMMQELQNRERDLKERYETRLFELDQAKELREAGYDKEARAMVKEARADLRGIENSLAENESAMERLRYSERAATERTRIQELGDEKRAKARQTEYNQRLEALITKQTNDRLSNVMTAPRDYTAARRKYNNAKTAQEREAAQKEVRDIFEREKERTRAEFGATGGIGTEIDFATAFPQG